MIKLIIIRNKTFVGKHDETNIDANFTDVVEFQTVFNPQQGGVVLVGTLLGGLIRTPRSETQIEFELSKDSPYWKAYLATVGNLRVVN